MKSDVNENRSAIENRSVVDVLNEMKEEAKRFLQTRMELLKSELKEKLPNLKIAALLAALGAVLLVTAYLLLTLALVALVAVAFKDNDYRWALALVSVGVLWCIIGGGALYFAKREFELKGLAPKRTIGVLKGDKIWIEREAKNEI